ncbi:hypothetical protein IID24_04740 [Patescibacteria group bacterium]|nr:hypothetical protein [Patescibacteria group bacterium]
MLLPIVLMILMASNVFGADKAGTDTGYLGAGSGEWIVQTDGDIIPVLTTQDIGESGFEISNFYADNIWLGGVQKSSWGSVVSPWEDSGTTTFLTSQPAKFIATHSSGDFFATGLTSGTGDITLENSQVIDGGTNNKIILTENSDSLTFEFDGNDMLINMSDGGIQFKLTDATDGTVDFMTNNDADDYIQISTSGNQSTINFVGQNGKITAASGTIDFDNENLTTTGTLASGATTVTSLIIGDDTLDVVTDDELRFASNDTSSTIEAYGFEGGDGLLLLTADQSDDNGDEWLFESDASTNSYIISNDTSGSMVAKWTMATSGNITTTGDILIAGTTPKLTIGDAGAEDTVITFDGNAVDYYIGLDDTDDDLNIGVGSTPGTTAAIEIDSNQNVAFTQNVLISELNFAADGEANDTYVITLAPAPAAYKTGMLIIFTANTLNTGACTINVNGLGAKNLLSLNNITPPDSYIEAGSVVMAVYDGTSFQMLQPDANP